MWAVAVFRGGEPAVTDKEMRQQPDICRTMVDGFCDIILAHFQALQN